MHELSSEDREFRRAFEAGLVEPADFDHRAHLRLAYIHLAEHGADGASTTFRESLLAYLAQRGIDPRKYHETLTQAWLLAVWHFMSKAGPTKDAADFLGKSGTLLDSSVMLSHYSAERLFSASAREAFLDPDIDPIPRHD